MQHRGRSAEFRGTRHVPLGKLVGREAGRQTLTSREFGVGGAVGADGKGSGPSGVSSFRRPSEGLIAPSPASSALLYDVVLILFVFCFVFTDLNKRVSHEDLEIAARVRWSRVSEVNMQEY